MFASLAQRVLRTLAKKFSKTLILFGTTFQRRLLHCKSSLSTFHKLRLVLYYFRCLVLNTFWPIVFILIFFLQLVLCLKSLNWVNFCRCKPDRDSVSLFKLSPKFWYPSGITSSPSGCSTVWITASFSRSRITSQGLSFLRTCPRLFKRWKEIMFLPRDKPCWTNRNRQEETARWRTSNRRKVRKLSGVDL